MSRFPIVEPPAERVWVEQKRKGIRGDRRFIVRFSMAREAIQGRRAWSVSILEKGRGCLHERHAPQDCRAAPTVVVRVFYDPQGARQAWEDAVAGRWGRLYGSPGAPWRGAREKSGPNYDAPQHRLWERYARQHELSQRAPPEPIDPPTLKLKGAGTLPDKQQDWVLVGGTWVRGEVDEG